MRLSKLRRKLRKQARKVKSYNDKTNINIVLNDPAKLRLLNERIEAEVNPWNEQGLIRGDEDGWDWSTWLANAWDWFVANWPKILNIIITIAPLLLLEPKHEDS